jgi:hypothetical protein
MCTGASLPVEKRPRTVDTAPSDKLISSTRSSNKPVSYLLRHQKIVCFISDANCAMNCELGLGGNIPLSRAQKIILSNTDFYLPFRELAKSRRLICRHLDLEFMKTRAGFFTLLLQRNILWNSEAFRTTTCAKYRFQDMDKWRKYEHQLH